MRLILASSSPRRAELLTTAGLLHEVIKPVTELEEKFAATWADQAADEFAMRLASLKALAVARTLPRQRAVVLGADTIAEHRGQILGKPRDRSDALKMLKQLCGASHAVITGMALIFLDSGKLLTSSVTTRVRLGADDGTLLRDYVAAGLADGKAGSYGIQDPLIAALVEEVTGSFDNVVGLPVLEFKDLLKTHGVHL
jgi:septum formation protein